MIKITSVRKEPDKYGFYLGENTSGDSFVTSKVVTYPSSQEYVYLERGVLYYFRFHDSLGHQSWFLRCLDSTGAS